MSLHCTIAVLVLSAALPVGAIHPPPIHPPPSHSPPPHLEAALAAAKWIKAHEIELERGVTWPIAPAATGAEAQPSATLYAGSPGVILFFIELARFSGDPSWLDDARAGGDALIADLDAIEERDGVGLYVGLSGVGHALWSLFRETKEAKYRIGADIVLDRISAAAHSSQPPESWRSTSDIVSGLAGTGMFLLEMAERPGEIKGGDQTSDFRTRMALNLAREAGDRLLELAREDDGGGFSWEITPGFRNSYPNFSHGAAGVSYFLASLYDALGERDPTRQKYLDAAVRGAEYLIAIADRDDDGGACRVPRFDPDEYAQDEARVYYYSWCHGPAGTARLFQRLFEVTGEERWRTWRDRLGEATLRANLAAGDAQTRLNGWWNNVGLCCGNAGTAMFALDMHAATSDERYLALARALVTDLLQRADRDGESGGLFWTHAEHRIQPDNLQQQSGLMQGAAGIGLALLRMHALDHGVEWLQRLPDDPF